MQREYDASERNLVSSSRESALIQRKQPLLGIIVGSAVFAAVMFLMLLAVRQVPSVIVTKSTSRSEASSTYDPSAYLAVEDLLTDFRVTAAGSRELAISGNLENTGTMNVQSADLKCYFRTRDGGESSLDFLLVVDTMLDQIEAGPLKPMSSRRFGARAGNFPENLEPEVLRFEIVNVRTQKAL